MGFSMVLSELRRGTPAGLFDTNRRSGIRRASSRPSFDRALPGGARPEGKFAGACREEGELPRYYLGNGLPVCTVGGSLRFILSHTRGQSVSWLHVSTTCILICPFRGRAPQRSYRIKHSL